MTQTPPNKSSSSPTEPEAGAGAGSDDGKGAGALPAQAASGAPNDASVPAETARSYAGTFAKGCGCLVICIVLGVGVAFVGRGELSSVGSALVGVLFLVLIMGSSGLTGWWNKNS
jgi:hypothetical protein